MKINVNGNLEYRTETWHDPGPNEPIGAGAPCKPREVDYIDGAAEINIDLSDVLEEVIANKFPDVPFNKLGFELIEMHDNGNIVLEAKEK